VTGASSCTAAHLGWRGPVQFERLTTVLSLPYRLNSYYYYYYYYYYYCYCYYALLHF